MKRIVSIVSALAFLAGAVSCEKDEVGHFTKDAVIPADVVVDLGLSVKWRSGNLNAEYAQDCGDYYAWGELEPHYSPGDAYKVRDVVWLPGKTTGYSNDSYMFADGYRQNAESLLPEDDAARQILGDGWRIPTDEEWHELAVNCNRKWTVLCGKEGVKFTSKVKGFKGKYIFIPAAGWRSETVLNCPGTCVKCWSSSSYSGYLNGTSCDATFMRYLTAYDLARESQVGEYSGMSERFYGLTIRPVLDKNESPEAGPSSVRK